MSYLSKAKVVTKKFNFVLHKNLIKYFYLCNENTLFNFFVCKYLPH